VAIAKQSKNLVFSEERERFSNFVVDLRQVEKSSVTELRREEKKVKRWWRSSAQKLDQIVKKSATVKINLNLLAKHQASHSQSIVRRSWWLSRLIAKLSWPRVASRLAWRRPLTVRLKRTESLLVKFIREQEKIFNAPPRLAVNQLPDPRLLRAEGQIFWYRSTLSFLVVLILLIVPFKILAYFQVFDLQNLEQRIMARSQFAFSNLLAATDSATQLDFKTADSHFQEAGASFLAAEQDLNQINDGLLSLTALSSNPKVKLAAESKKFLRAGALSAALGSNLAQATNSLFNQTEIDFSRRLDNFLQFGNLAAQDAQNLEQVISTIQVANLPVDYRSKFIALASQSDLLVNNLSNFVSLGAKLKEVLGLSKDKRYLVVFQNNSELRASGGFIGSYALVDLKNGRINNLEVPGGGSYDTEGGMQVRVAAPEPLTLVNPLWHFWDANWWPDWPTTSENLMWFYGKSGGPSVDGVIGLTPTVIERLLAITGPIDLQAEYGLTIDADNFWDTVQKITEQDNLLKTNPAVVSSLPTSSAVVKSDLPLQQGLEINASHKPKKIIGDLLVKILAVLPQKLTRDNLVKIIALFEQNMSEKQILFYFKDANLQQAVASENWAGEIRPSNYDYLSVVNTNIAGQKTDRVIKQQLSLTSEVAADGSIINTLKIWRTHQGVKGEVLTGVRNVDWLRVYVPGGSELLAADGFVAPEAKYFSASPTGEIEHLASLDNERAALSDGQTGTKIYREQDKTVFANWSMIDPGTTAVITLRYRLPFNLFAKTTDQSWLTQVNSWLNPNFGRLSPYSLLVQKQPGAAASDLVSRLILPSASQVFWHYPDSLTGTNGWSIQETLDRDRYWSILVKDPNH
jgi:hypothetical protein